MKMIPVCMHQLGESLRFSTMLLNVVLVHLNTGASHLREVFYRMGLSDKDIVALSGGHTLVNISEALLHLGTSSLYMIQFLPFLL